ncbi:MAG: hypothetical protein C0490_26270 [Marivirga sp.]|nr:hypothetical protein [Marivirga sp.]
MKLFRTISIIAFCLLVVFSSSSFMIGIHICSGNIQDVALFTKAQSCANEKKMPPCHKQESKPCCEDESVIHEGQDVKSDISKLQLAPVPVVDIDKPLVLIAEVIPSASLAKTKYYNYDPPLRSTDLTVSFQVFLI